MTTWAAGAGGTSARAAAPGGARRGGTGGRGGGGGGPGGVGGAGRWGGGPGGVRLLPGRRARPLQHRRPGLGRGQQVAYRSRPPLLPVKRDLSFTAALLVLL